MLCVPVCVHFYVLCVHFLCVCACVCVSLSLSGHTHVLPVEVTQEVAARGMGLVYDMSESEGRKDLVQSLVGTLIEGRK